MRKVFLVICEKIKLYFSDLSRILKFVGFIGVVISLFQLYHFTIKSRSNDLESFNNLRSLSSSYLEINDDKIKTNKLLEHEFILNITQIPYQGNWSLFTFPNKEFDNNFGEAELSIFKYPIITKQKYSDKSNSLLLSLMIKDGKYIDHFFKGNITITLPQDINKKIKANQPFTINKLPGILSYYQGDLFENYGFSLINTTLITITFYPMEKHFDDGVNFSTYNLWSKISLLITDPKEGIIISFLCEMTIPKEKNMIIFNYSLFITLISFFQIFYSLDFLIKVNDNNLSAIHADFIAISIQILWNSLLCAVHFFLAISNEKYLYYLVSPSMAYFILFSIFELKILFIVWKAKFDHLMNTDIGLFRKKLLQFYFIFYFMLFTSMISLRFWYNHFGLAYLFFSSSWLFQIVYSAKEGTKPPMNYEYIFWFTLGKIVFPIFLKGCTNDNIFDLKPEYTKMIVLMLQKLRGPQFFLPKFMRKIIFDYYKDYNELLDQTNDCVICLEKLNKVNNIALYISQDDTNSNDNKNLSSITDSEYNRYDYVGMLVNKLKHKKLRKPYMVTPCFHEFHSSCLEKWIQCKSECPYCRRIIPLYDE